MTEQSARVGISTISFRHRPLAEALELIAATGATEIDLGAIPDVTDHVPVPFTGDAAEYARAISAAGLRAGAVNADPGDLNDPALDTAALTGIVQPLVELSAALDAALIVPAGRASYEPFVDRESDLAQIAASLQVISRLCAARGVRLLVEVLHHRRFVHTVADADALLATCPAEQLGVLYDVSHVVASDEDPLAWATSLAGRIERVHLRDAVPGNLNLALGAGVVDFDALVRLLEAQGFAGSYILELETHDVAEEDREQDVRRSHAEVVQLLSMAR
jgi:sugar phosphate isomerase/epimerase